MNKSELINAMAEEAGLSKADAKKALDAFVSTVSKTLAGGDKIVLIGFGTFSINEKGERTGINPLQNNKLLFRRKRLLNLKPVQN